MVLNSPPDRSSCILSSSSSYNSHWFGAKLADKSKETKGIGIKTLICMRYYRPYCIFDSVSQIVSVPKSSYNSQHLRTFPQFGGQILIGKRGQIGLGFYLKLLVRYTPYPNLTLPSPSRTCERSNLWNKTDEP